MYFCLFNLRYEQWITSYFKEVSPVLGFLGEPVYLSPYEKENEDELFNKTGIDVLVSNKIPWQRRLPDVRNPL